MKLNGGRNEEREVKSKGNGFDMGLLPAIGLAFTLAANFVGRRYLRYWEAKCEIEDSEELMQDTLDFLETKPRHTWDQYPSHMFVLKRWGKRREEAAAYMEKHKLIGKLIKFFHPKKTDNTRYLE